MKTDSLLGLSPHGFHRIAYTEWGEATAPRTVICVHGLTRNGRDFDRLAAALSERCRVICPDMPGRGRSDWIAESDYTYPQYLADMAALIARLILNDVGPFVPKAALLRLAEYVGKDPHFTSLDELEAYLRQVHAPFGPLGDQDWRHLALQGYRRLEGGGFGLAYDPAIGKPFQNGKIEDVDLWPVWDAVRCPVFVLRGAQSDLLLSETAREMARRGPKAKTTELSGIGHAPALVTEDQIALVRDWLSTSA
jgi:pimeloyl-ACP methyl ester carboxylesterase